MQLENRINGQKYVLKYYSLKKKTKNGKTTFNFHLYECMQESVYICMRVSLSINSVTQKLSVAKYPQLIFKIYISLEYHLLFFIKILLFRKGMMLKDF